MPFRPVLSRIRSESSPIPVTDPLLRPNLQKVTRPANVKPTIAVVGVGYVGTHLVQAFSKHYSVVAFDTSVERVTALKREFPAASSVLYTSDRHDLKKATHFLVSVPTPINEARQIDVQYLEQAIETVGMYIKPGGIIVIESSVAIGTTRKLLGSMAVRKGIKGGMSPERVDPGRTDPAFEKIPKVVSGLDDISPGSLQSIQELYAPVFENVVPVSQPEVAEMMKLYENCQRLMCIAFANEMADACLHHGIDSQEVAKAAATKPFGYLPMYPGIGVGGPCIPVNPFYLFSTDEFPLLRAATDTTHQRPAREADRIMSDLLKSSPTPAKDVRVLVVGVGFKRGQSLVSHSPGVCMLRQLQNRWDARCYLADPLVAADSVPFATRLDEKTEWQAETLETFDLIVVAVRQEGLDLGELERLRHPTVKFVC